MTAQYRPYRDEDASDSADQEHLNWAADTEPGSLQIYEKTTEDLPFGGSRRFLLSLFSVVGVAILVGFLVGFFSHSHSSCTPTHSVALNSVIDADLNVRNKILAGIDRESMRATIEDFATDARLPSSPADLTSIHKVVSFFRQHNLDRIEMKNYSVLLSLPDQSNPNVIEIIESQNNRVIFSTMNESKTTKHFSSEYIAYSPSGDVISDVVFVNYGHASDYQELKELGISVKGKIVLVKQLNLAADEQLRLAQEAEAVALLLYPDSAEVGSGIPTDAVRRDSLIWNGQGDPQTPGYPSTSYAFRTPIEDIKILPKIPVQSISLSTALQILILMGGRPAPEKWTVHSNSSFEFHLGPGFQKKEYRVRVKITNRLELREITNVIGSIRGTVEPDRYVLVGNHRDSWAEGALDAAGGMAGMFELVKLFTQLMRSGWKPRRTIMFCSWGSEEMNLMGSTEWIEENIKILQQRAVAYINTDILAVGNSSLSVAASPLLYQVIYNATKQVLHPGYKPRTPAVTLYDTWLSSFPSTRNISQLVYASHASSSSSRSSSHSSSSDLTDEQLLDLSRHGEELIEAGTTGEESLLTAYVNAANQRIRPKVRSLDSRSVYAPFFMKAGIPALEVTFIPSASDKEAASETYPLIHTQYDTMDLLNKFDKNLLYHSAVTQVIGEVIRDLADSLFLPFNLLDYAQVLRDFFVSLQLHATVFSTNGLDFALLDSAIKNFSTAALTFHTEQQHIDRRDPMAIRRVNDQLLLLERMFLDPNGLPRNPDKKHVVLSPSETMSSSGYEEMFPGLMDEFAYLVHSDFGSLSWSWDILKAHFSILIFTIQSAADFISHV